MPLALGIALYVAVAQGFQGDAAKKRQKDYWRHNIATWKEKRDDSRDDAPSAFAGETVDRDTGSKVQYGPRQTK